MSVNICSKLCGECPFSKNSPQGWLAEYTVDDIKTYQNQEVLFPCHLMVKDEDMSQGEVTEAIENGDMKLCRGYVESMIKSCKMPKYSETLKQAIAIVKEQGLSENSMSIWDFKKHHE